MTQVLSEFASHLRSSLKSFSLSQSRSTEQIKSHLLALKIDSDEEITRLNTLLQRQIRVALTQIMGNGDLNKVGNLIALLCDLCIQQKYGQTKSLKPFIKQSLAIIIVADVLECLGINDLKQILPIITEKICLFKQLDVNDQNGMLRIINHLLKRISKTEDYLIRGQLQFTLTKILPICDDSGFHYRIPIAKGIQIAQNEEAEEQKAVFSSEGITYQFYKDFWELQKFLMDPNELSSQEMDKNVNEETPKKPVSAYKPEPLISLRLKHIERVFNDVIFYMTKHPCVHNSTSLMSQPIKFLTNTHLLQFQLSDEYFRKIILIQALVFTFTLKHLKPTGNILKNVMLAESERQTINKIQLTAQRYLENLQKNQSQGSFQNQQNQNTPLSILETMKCFFANELEWLQLKDHWKQKKKSFLRIQVSAPQTQTKEKKPKQSIDYNKKIAEIHNKIANQMSIEGDTLLKFLTEPCVPHIVTTPTQTSFAYFWSQGKSCLDGFDYESLQQHEFQTKSEYNMFEWKALRSLYKESTKQISLGEKNPKLREYKALALIQKKEKDLKEKQAKQNQENSIPSEPNGSSLPIIVQVPQNKEKSKEKGIEQNIAQKDMAQSPNDAENNEERGSQPSKKVKSD